MNNKRILCARAPEKIYETVDIPETRAINDRHCTRVLNNFIIRSTALRLNLLRENIMSI